MAKPRVFISSTFYDLHQIREELDRFVLDMAKPDDGPVSATHVCPKCGGSLVRIRRSFLDRWISRLFGRIQRYRCEQFGCDWQGTL